VYVHTKEKNGNPHSHFPQSRAESSKSGEPKMGKKLIKLAILISNRKKRREEKEGKFAAKKVFHFFSRFTSANENEMLI
jgi:hypothetical protein